MTLARRYPLLGFFVLALFLSWIAVLAILAGGRPLTWHGVVGITLGPTLAAVIMTAVSEGRPGLRAFGRRLVLWRVAPRWYAMAFLGIPAIFVAGTVVLPGALASFDPLTRADWAAYPQFLLLVLVVGGPLLEEPGWRGFALPRLQARFGPLRGTLVLGLAWAAWHFPQYLMPAWSAQNGGFTLGAVAVFTASVVPLTVVITWIFNHTRGSVLVAMLVHASTNTFALYIGRIFPAYASSQANLILGFGGFALLLIVLTRGRLGYDRYRRDTAAVDAPQKLAI